MSASDKNKRLGRGLSALLGETDTEGYSAPAQDGGHAPGKAKSRDGVRMIPIELIAPNPDQPRKTISEPELNALAESIADKGIVQPILVRPADGGQSFQIVAGERRWRAAQRARLHEVPALVRELTDRETLEIGIVENVQRADLNPVEEAQAYRQLIDRFGHTQEDVAHAVSKSRSHVANMMRLLSLPDSVLELLAGGAISAGHARAIANAPDPGVLAEEIVARGLSVRDAERMAREANNPPAAPETKSAAVSAGGSKDADTRALEADITARLGLAVDIRHGAKGGELRVQYKTLEQLDDVCRRLSADAARSH
ncbi:ParB/RepB/Spo0J family partition protein [Maricaulis sp.]|uniref:ParB/RepB/Spo0J family partition protein n=1 Tax=Maricaulis sp. TaxID=1486257 RepID=UPI0025BAB8ED|nr:ParB/RepB/Spo0J family partition protein [Maricaulis sp.]